MAKTIKLGNSAVLDDTSLQAVQTSVKVALVCLDDDARRQNREVLWGTLEIEVENNQIEDIQLASNVTRIHSNSRVLVSALAVLK